MDLNGFGSIEGSDVLLKGSVDHTVSTILVKTSTGVQSWFPRRPKQSSWPSKGLDRR